MPKPVLIFPAGMPRSLTYLERALSEGTSVIGSSSLVNDPAQGQYPLWVYLPYVTAPEFDQALRKTIDDHDIGGIFTPNAVVWDYLGRCIPESFPGLKLVNTSPIESETAPFRKALQFGIDVVANTIGLMSSRAAKPSVSELEIAALFRHAETIPGMCDHEKIKGLCEIFRHSPTGDVVEIGSWWGKSAFVLSRLAACYEVGKLLCVDPWSNEYLAQRDEKGLVDRVTVNANEALSVFLLNLLPYANGRVNYLRLPSVDAAAEYRCRRNVVSQAFGTTAYTARIAVLHVDGNHSYESARSDLVAWAGLMVPGGWIIIDDYVWPYGDGPQRVGDEFLDRLRDSISCAFVQGSALFIQVE